MINKKKKKNSDKKKLNLLDLGVFKLYKSPVNIFGSVLSYHEDNMFTTEIFKIRY